MEQVNRAVAGKSDTSDAEGPVSKWDMLPSVATGKRYLEPGALVKGMASISLVPVVFSIFYSSLPDAVKSRLGWTSLTVWLLALAGAIAFLLTLAVFRALRKRGQLRLNTALGDNPPPGSLLYLRSFRRTGMTVVPNHLPSLVERRLLGNFLDVELALSMAVAEKFPVVAVGSTPDSLGAAKFHTDDQNWQELVLRLADIARVIFIVPDDREGTLWELERLLTDPALRRKTIVMMPPEQGGWWRRLRRLPSIAESWQETRRAKPELGLPAYQRQGAFLLPQGGGDHYKELKLQHFEPAHVQEIVSAVATSTLPDDSAALSTAPDENWRAHVDPIWPAVTIGVLVLTWTLGDLSVQRFDAVLLAILVGSLASWVVAAGAFTHTRAPGDAERERFYASTWFGLRSAPRLVRGALNLFVVIAAVALIRFFLYEPFKIPSGSMAPTLLVGDVILVNKYQQGVRLPLIHTKLLGMRGPRRGDVMVFRYPRDPSVDYIKRVIGLPGDTVEVRNQRLFINDKEVPSERVLPDYFDEDSLRYLPHYTETLGDSRHRVLVDPSRAGYYDRRNGVSFPYEQNCRYSAEGVRCTVPAGHYFVMGDNRDNSEDSRYWGFVPDKNVIGRASVVVMNFGKLGRIGTQP